MTTITINSQSPYFDDFDESKNFSKILFKPGYAVQARELTQLQTIIQNQIARFGEHVFKEGSIVSNGKSDLQKSMYVSIIRPDNLFIVPGDYLVGDITGATATVNYVESTGQTSLVWITISSGVSFDFTETVTVTNKGVIEFAAETPYQFGSVFSLESSVFFVKGAFVYIEASKMYIKDSNLSARLGLTISEEIVTSSTDSTLLDPAQGSYNYSAPGADRQAIILTLDSKNFTEFSDDIDLLSSENFIELIRVSNGQILKTVKFTDYNMIGDTLARRTYDESGDYCVTPFIAKTKTKPFTTVDLETNPAYSEDDSTEVVLEISQGKAYVKGYEFTASAATNILVKKARETKTVSGASAFYDYKRYVYVTNVSGNPDLSVCRQVNLRNVSNAVIGTAYVTGLDYESSNLYRLNLANIKFIGAATIGSVTNVISAATVPFIATVDLTKYTNSIPTISSSYNSVAFVTTPAIYVKTLLNDSSAADTVWDAVKQFSVTLIGTSPTASGDIVNSTPNQNFVGSGSLSEAIINRYFTAVVTSNSGTGPIVGTLLTYANGLRISINSPSNLTVTYENATNFGTGGGNSITVYAKVSCANWQHKTKTLTNSTYVHNTPYDTVIKLDHSDGYKLTSVVATYASTAVEDLTSNFVFDNGHRDDIYDFATISASSLPINITSLAITYSYFAHSGQGFFSVDSYINSGIKYSEIPLHRSHPGKTYRLSDVLDFRPAVATALTTTSNILPVTDEDLNFDYSYYLGRKDKLVVTTQMQFKVIEGMSSETPDYPEDNASSMLLYFIDVNPYTFDHSDVKLTYVDNSRYTMKDISKLEKRIDAIEYYTALSLLEKQAQEAKTPSSTPGLEKFKSGILVDPFNDHAVGDTENQDYKCSIDFEERELRSLFKSNPYKFKVDSLTGAELNDYLVMLPFTETEMISQKLCSGTRNLNPNENITWFGYLVISPNSNTQITKGTTLDIYVTKSAAGVYSIQDGTRWNTWLAEISGLDAAATVFSSSATKIVKKTSTKITDATNPTFMKAETISFVATGLLPNTQMYITVNSNPFFSLRYVELQFANHVPPTTDTITSNSKVGTCANVHQDVVFLKTGGGFAVNDVVSFKDKTGAVLGTGTVTKLIESSELTTNKYGVVCGVFAVTENTIPAGNESIMISNVMYGAGPCTANATFTASGSIQSDANITITTTVEPKPVVVPPKTETPVVNQPTPVPTVTVVDAVEPVGPLTEPTTGSHWVHRVVGYDDATLVPAVIGQPYTISSDHILYKGKINWARLPGATVSDTLTDSYDIRHQGTSNPNKYVMEFRPHETNASASNVIPTGKEGMTISQGSVKSISISRATLAKAETQRTFYEIYIKPAGDLVSKSPAERLSFLKGIAGAISGPTPTPNALDIWVKYPESVNQFLGSTTTAPATSTSGFGILNNTTNVVYPSGTPYDTEPGVAKAPYAPLSTGPSTGRWSYYAPIWVQGANSTFSVTKGTSTNSIVFEVWLKNVSGWNGDYGLAHEGSGAPNLANTSRKIYTTTLAQSQFNSSGSCTVIVPAYTHSSSMAYPFTPPAPYSGSSMVAKGYIEIRVYDITNPAGAAVYTGGEITVWADDTLAKP